MLDMDTLRYISEMRIAPNIVAFIVGIPSGILYAIEVLLVLGNWKKFNSSFFKLFIIRAIINIYNLFFSYLAPRFPLFGFFFAFYEFLPRICLNFFLFSSYYTFHAENLSTTALALNRLTAIVYPISYENIWKRLLPICVAIIFAIPLLINYDIFQLHMTLYFYDKSNTSFGFVNIDGAFPRSNMNSYSTIAFAIICCTLNIGAWLALRRHTAKFKKEGGNNNNNTVAMEHNRMERRLFTFSFCTFFCQFVMAIFYYGVYLATLYGRQYFWADLLSDALWYHYGLLNDLCTVVVPAWLMLWSSSVMRNILAEKILEMKNLLGFTTMVCASSNQNQVQPYGG